MSVLCKLGFHKWKYNALSCKASYRVCMSCPKEQRLMNIGDFNRIKYWKDVK